MRRDIAMTAEYFRCPHCKARLKKSDADQMLGEAGGFMVFGSATRTCPTCGEDIDRTSLIQGKYDDQVKASAADTIGCLVVIGGILVLTLGFEWVFWQALIVSLVVGGVVMKAVEALKRR
jgi:hypothetical protein